SGGSAPKIDGIRAEFLVSAGSNQKIVLKAQASSAFPVNSWFDGENHAFTHGRRHGLMRERRLVCARAHSMRHGMRRLAGIPGRADPLANHPVQFGETG